MNIGDLEHIDVNEAGRRLEEIVMLVESGEVPGFVLCMGGQPSALMLPPERKSPLATFDSTTLAFYTAQATDYVNVRPRGVWRDLPDFLERLPKGGSILELGCGGGCDAAHMLKAGFDVDPTDGVPEMAAQAEARLGIPVRVLRFDELDADARYDAVIAHASLLHVPLAGLPDILSRVWRALKPGGWHVASYKTGGGEGYDEHGRYYNRPSAAQAEALYRSAGDWAVQEVDESFQSGHFGKPSAWLTIVVRKP